MNPWVLVFVVSVILMVLLISPNKKKSLETSFWFVLFLMFTLLYFHFYFNGAQEVMCLLVSFMGIIIIVFTFLLDLLLFLGLKEFLMSILFFFAAMSASILDMVMQSSVSSSHVVFFPHVSAHIISSIKLHMDTNSVLYTSFGSEFTFLNIWSFHFSSFPSWVLCNYGLVENVDFTITLIDNDSS